MHGRARLAPRQSSARVHNPDPSWISAGLSRTHAQSIAVDSRGRRRRSWDAHAPPAMADSRDRDGRLDSTPSGIGHRVSARREPSSRRATRSQTTTADRYATTTPRSPGKGARDPSIGIRTPSSLWRSADRCQDATDRDLAPKMLVLAVHSRLHPSLEALQREPSRDARADDCASVELEHDG